MKLQIDPNLFKINPALALGVIISNVQVQLRNEELWGKLQSLGEDIKCGYATTDESEFKGIDALRTTYKELGLPLSKYVGSNEALLKRLKQGKGMYQINSVVDVNNYISLESMRSVGSYDLSKISGDEVTFRSGQNGDTYPSTKKRTLALHKLPVLADCNGPFGSPTSDSDRALITTETTQVMTVIFSFDGQEDLERQLINTKQNLEQYAHASVGSSFILSSENPSMEFNYSDTPAVNINSAAFFQPAAASTTLDMKAEKVSTVNL